MSTPTYFEKNAEMVRDRLEEKHSCPGGYGCCGCERRIMEALDAYHEWLKEGDHLNEDSNNLSSNSEKENA